MKRIKKLTLLALIIPLFTFFIIPQPAYAENEAEGDGLDEILVNNNDFEGKDCGWFEVEVKNVDKDINNSIIYIQFINYDEQQVYTVNVSKPNKWKTREKLPVGKYTVMTAGVEGDNKSVYPITPIQDEFEVNHTRSAYVGLEMENTSLFKSSNRNTDEQKKANKEYKDEKAKKQKAEDDKKSNFFTKLIIAVLVSIVAIAAAVMKYVSDLHKEY